MKRTIIGGILSITSSIWLCSLYPIILNNMVAEYFDPPGQFFSTVIHLNLAIPIIFFSLCSIAGFAIIG